MPDQTPQTAANATNATSPTRECPPATTGPQTGTQGRDAQLAAAWRLGHEHGSAYATDRYADGYAAARRYYGDTAPLALGKVRARLDQYTDMYGGRNSIVPGGVISDLYAILDTAKEPHHD